MGKICVFLLLAVGFFLLFYRVSMLKIPEYILKQTKSSMEAASRQRLLANRMNLQKLKEEHSVWYRLECMLNYSGILRKLPGLTAEKWLLCNLLCLSGILCMCTMLFGFAVAVLLAVSFIGAEWVCLYIGRAKMHRAVDKELLKFLDFLGNYSVTAGEVTGVFNQISRYLEEPLRSVLDECYMEARTTGDVGMALLSLAEKVEHAKFRELIQNIEISARYCADFKALVAAGRRSVREYLRMNEERKGMLREAVINMVLLLLMSAVILLSVEGLLGVSISSLLFGSMPGKLALLVVTIILLLFGRQICSAFG